MSSDPDQSPGVHVMEYLMGIEPAMALTFDVVNKLLPSVADLPERIKQLESFRFGLLKQARRWSGVKTGGILKEPFKHADEQAAQEIVNLNLRLRNAQSEQGAKCLDVNAAASSIIFMAQHGIDVGKQHGPAAEGREVRPNYKLKNFIRLARNHAAHYSETISGKQIREREDFQLAVLNYDQRTDGSFVNHSFKVLEILDWRSWDNVREDILSLFDPTGESQKLGR